MKTILIIGIVIIVLIGLYLFVLAPKDTQTPSGNPLPEGQIVIEQNATVAASYAPECADVAYWSDNADYIIESTVEEIETIGNVTAINLAIKNYLKGTPFADKFKIEILGGYSTSDVVNFYKEGEMVRNYLVDVAKFLNDPERAGEFGFVCQGVEQI